jgi:hypothetical protein
MIIKTLTITLTLIFSISLQAQEIKETKEVKDNKFELLAKDVFFQPGGGLRVRYDYLDGATGGSFKSDEREGQATHRANFDLKLYKGEYIETFFRFINNAEWGGASGDTNGGQKDSFTSNNGLLVNQAWALWKVDDLIGIRFGRAPLNLGLGYTYGLNDWFNVPYSFDLFDMSFDWESVELSLVIAKVLELTKIPNQTTNVDPEENHIIVNAEINNLFDFLNIFNFSLVQVNRDLGSKDGTTVLNGLNMQRLALEMQIRGKRIFGSTFVTYVTGEQKLAPANIIGGIDKLKISQSALDLKLGYRFPESNNLRFWGGIHYDSGDSSALDDKSQTYDSFYYDVYGQSGLMDLIRWGNLTFYRLGLDVEILNEVTLGSEWIEFSKTESADTLNFGQGGRFLTSLIKSSDMVLGNAKNVGSEFDIWCDFKYDSGMKIRGTFSTFFPGQVFKQATTTSNAAPTSTISQFLVQIGYNF